MAEGVRMGGLTNLPGDCARYGLCYNLRILIGTVYQCAAEEEDGKVGCGERERMTRSVAVHSYKGGTGKTTILANVAVALALKGRRVGVMNMIPSERERVGGVEVRAGSWEPTLLWTWRAGFRSRKRSSAH